tara:strand:+ start:496 stop:771 length:276 start_codon:yes stop_codon:yes gene_type:complete
MMVLSYTNAIMEYNRRRSGLPSAPIDMEYNNSSIEQLPHHVLLLASRRLEAGQELGDLDDLQVEIYVYLFKKRVDISILVMGYASDIIQYN